MVNRYEISRLKSPSLKDSNTSLAQVFHVKAFLVTWQTQKLLNLQKLLVEHTDLSLCLEVVPFFLMETLWQYPSRKLADLK